MNIHKYKSIDDLKKDIPKKYHHRIKFIDKNLFKINQNNNLINKNNFIVKTNISDYLPIFQEL